MLESYPWLSVLPPVAAIAIAIKFRQVFVALFIGIWAGATILSNGNIFTGFIETINRMMNVFQSQDDTKVIFFTLLVGALLAFLQRSGGVNGFIEMMSKKQMLTTPRRAQFLSVIIGGLIAVDTNLSVLITGTVSRPIYDKLKISREKLAYIADSTCAPVSCLTPVNAWGAYVASLLAAQQISEPYKVYLYSIPLNFYSICAILVVIFLVITQKDFFSMKTAEKRAREEGKVLRDGAIPLVSTEIISLEPKEGIKLRASNMVIPTVTVVLMMVVGMFITGNGTLTEGSGSTSVLFAVIAAVLVIAVQCGWQKILSFKEMTDLFFTGAGGMIPLAVLMVFAFAIGQLTKDLQTGAYVAGLTQNIISPNLLPFIVFVVTSFIAFSTGTSWGTFAIMTPIGVGIAQAFGLNVVPVVAAVLSGGVFGDHCSPISDSTLVSSMASASDHMDHVNTQLPYALAAGAIASGLFLVTGFIIY